MLVTKMAKTATNIFVINAFRLQHPSPTSVTNIRHQHTEVKCVEYKFDKSLSTRNPYEKSSR